MTVKQPVYEGPYRLDGPHTVLDANGVLVAMFVRPSDAARYVRLESNRHENIAASRAAIGLSNNA